MSQVTYNQVELPYPFHSSFNVKSVYEDSNTDWYATHFTLNVECVLNSNYISLLAPNLLMDADGDPYTTEPALIMRALREKLMRPRRTLSVKVNGQEMVPVIVGNTGTVDVQNGPRPQYCNITSLGNSTFWLSYGIEGQYWENNTQPTAGTAGQVFGSKGNTALYNRWRESVSINKLGQSTRTRSGKCAIRSDNREGLTADGLRSKLAVVSVPDGFTRESSDYVQDPGGLILEYTVVDKERFKMPPFPAFDAEGEYSERATDAGAMRYAECWCRLEGSNLTDQALLIRTAVGIVAQKCLLQGLQNGLIEDAQGEQSGFVESAVLRVSLYENWVHCHITGMLPAKDERISLIAFGEANMPSTPGSPLSRRTPPSYLDRGSANLLLQAAKYWDPSLVGVELGQSPIIAPDVTATTTGDARVNHTQGTVIGKAGVELEPRRFPFGP